jgi:hypothetical protein
MEMNTTDIGAAHDLVPWRREQQAAAGFTLPLAFRLARNARYDLHGLIELTERGCAPDLAMRILAPLDAEAAIA